ncbi:unnamed protein product, partial [Amoebophrya sp. A25]
VNGLLVERTSANFRDPVQIEIQDCGLASSTVYELYVYAENAADTTDGFLYRLSFRTMPSNELIQLYNRQPIIVGYQAATRLVEVPQAEYEQWEDESLDNTFGENRTGNESLYDGTYFGGAINVTDGENYTFTCLEFNRSAAYSAFEIDVKET